MSLTKSSYSMTTGAPTNVLDFIPAQYHADIKNETSTVDLQQYIQAAMDSGAGELYFPMGYYIIRSPLYITAGAVGSTQRNDLTFVGENRTTTYLAVDGFTASPLINPVTGLGIVSMLINQSNNGKFTLKNIRFQGNLPLGHVMYSLENGTDSQCLFSGLIENCWFSLGETNNGYFFGGLQNYQISNNVFESAKSCFRLAGAGCGDLNFVNNSVYASYDSFIEADSIISATTKNIINVTNLNVYGHSRGAIFSGTNINRMNISNVNFQGTDGVSLGTLGLCDFKDCVNINITNFNCYEGVLNDVIKLSGTSAKISNGFIGACNSGIYISGSNSIDLTVTNVNISGATVSSFYHATGNPGGVVEINDCRWANSGGYHWVDQTGTATYGVTFNGGVFLNAGFPNTSAGSRNFGFNTTGDVRFNNSLIGRTSTDAIANNYFENIGTGSFILTDCTFTTLAAPSGTDITGAQLVKIAGGLGNRYRQYYASAAPTTGTWSLGDRVFNTAPSVGQPKGWLCTVAGTPGTWVSEGNL